MRPTGTTRESIVEAARLELATHGLASMTIRQVARTVGVDPGTIRHYFPAKGDLARAATDPELDMAVSYQRVEAELPQKAGANVVHAAARLIPDSTMSRAAVAACLTGGALDDTVFGSFAREVVAPAAERISPHGVAERSAVVMSSLIGLHLLKLVVPATQQTLEGPRVSGILAQTVDGFLEDADGAIGPVAG